MEEHYITGEHSPFESKIMSHSFLWHQWEGKMSLSTDGGCVAGSSL